MANEVYYGLVKAPRAPDTQVLQLALKAGHALEHFQADSINLGRILDRRQNQAKLFFNQVAGRFDRRYGAGSQLAGFGQMLLRMMPALDIADLGSGEGLLAELLALNAKSVIAVDNSPSMVEYGKRKAQENGLPVFPMWQSGGSPLDDASWMWLFSARPTVMPTVPRAPSLRPIVSSDRGAGY